jgi:hypothetical protein
MERRQRELGDDRPVVRREMRHLGVQGVRPAKSAGVLGRQEQEVYTKDGRRGRKSPAVTVADLVKGVAIPGSLKVAEHGRQEIARPPAHKARRIEVAADVVRALCWEVAQNAPNLKQTRPFKGMIQVGHVGAQALRGTVSKSGRQERPLLGRLEPDKRGIRHVEQGIPAEQSVADGPVPAGTSSVYPPAGPEDIEHAEPFRQFGQWLTRLPASRHRVQDLVQPHDICASRADDVRQPGYVQPAVLARPTMDIIGHYPYRLLSPLWKQLSCFSPHPRRVIASDLALLGTTDQYSMGGTAGQTRSPPSTSAVDIPGIRLSLYTLVHSPARAGRTALWVSLGTADHDPQHVASGLRLLTNAAAGCSRQGGMGQCAHDFVCPQAIQGAADGQGGRPSRLLGVSRGMPLLVVAGGKAGLSYAHIRNPYDYDSLSCSRIKLYELSSNTVSQDNASLKLGELLDKGAIFLLYYACCGGAI